MSTNITKKTVLVSGDRHSGTSMVALVLEILGIPMGEENMVDITLEDREIWWNLGDKTKLREIIAKRNKRWDIWGVKRPDLIAPSAQLGSLLRNPYYIIMFRDPVAISVRTKFGYGPYEDRLPQYTLEDTIPNMLHHAKYSVTLLGSLRTHPSTTYVFSYEKVLIKPRDFVLRLVEILKLKTSEATITDAVSCITPEVGFEDKKKILYYKGLAKGRKLLCV